MPGPLTMATAAGLAAMVSAAVWLVASRFVPSMIESGRDSQHSSPLARKPSWPISLVGGASLALGLWAGYVSLIASGVVSRPRFPPQEDQHRLVILILPVVVVLEAALSRASPFWQMVCRGVFAAGMAPVLLYGSVYFHTLGSIGGADWGAIPLLGYLIAVSLLAMFSWSVLSQSAAHGDWFSSLLVTAIVSTCSGLAVILSGSLSGGSLGVPLTGALIGILLAIAIGKISSAAPAAIRVAFTLIFGILLGGQFYGSLLLLHAVLLVAAPALLSVAWIPAVRRMPTFARCVMVGVLVAGFSGAVVAHIASKQMDSSETQDASAYYK